MNKDELIVYLEKINFTKLESQIYLTLLEGGPMSPYQIAKKIDISRTSIYNSLEHMYDKGCVEILPDNTTTYIAQEPEVLLNKLKTEFNKSTDVLSKQLKFFKESGYEEKYANLKSYEIIISKVKEIIKEAKSEVYINTDIDIQEFREEIEIAINKGIKIILFSFLEINNLDLPIETYSHDRKRTNDFKPSRLMISVDNSIALIADCNKERDIWLGTVTNNKLMISVISEHIHNDIYLLKLRNKYGREIYKYLLYINSEFENRSKNKMRGDKNE